jgi:uncharacterized protein
VAGPGRRPDSLRRWLLALLGVLCVGLAAVGVVVPGMPTTVFLIAACWLFARSCPWLEEKLVRHRFFAPFHAYLEPGARMPRRARVTAMAAMWIAIAISVVLLGRGSLEGAHLWSVRTVVLLAGAVGTVVLLRVGRGDVAGAVPDRNSGRHRTAPSVSD